MKITSAHSSLHAVPLSRPYSIARGTIAAVDLFYLELRTDRGAVGLGSASPAPGVTGESPEACAAALAEASLDFLVGEDPRRFGRLRRLAAERLSRTPAALAAVDTAIWDLAGRVLEVPVVDLLGRRHGPLPTSITVGIQSLEETLEEAAEYVGRGFTSLKVKIGHDFDLDIERLERLRQQVGPGIAIRVDANQGYDPGEGEAARIESARIADRLLDLVERLDLELVEQPAPRPRDGLLGDWPVALRRLLAADESVHHAADALAIARHGGYGILNIKLMKCGGISGAMPIASIAEAAGLELMWGCMDESVVSIAAALHAAYASPRTRYLDLDGSFDLASDLATGGFELQGGRLQVLDEPGLGVRMAAG